MCIEIRCYLYCGVNRRAADSTLLFLVRYQTKRLRVLADRVTPYQHLRYVYLGLPPSPLIARPATGPTPHGRFPNDSLHRLKV